MAIYNKFRDKFKEQQDKSNSETNDLFFDVLTGIGNWVNEAVNALKVAQDNPDCRDIGIQQAKRILELLMEELY